MLNWYKRLYVGDNAKKKKKQLIRKINMGAGVIDVYLITLAQNPENQLDIFPANELKQKARRRTCPTVSYTHLDVYKRQIMHRGLMLSLYRISVYCLLLKKNFLICRFMPVHRWL